MSQNIQKSKSYPSHSQESHTNKKIDFKKKFQEFKEMMCLNNFPTYFYTVLILIPYIFYQFGYSFIYGFYFVGHSDFIILMDAFINQVPFNFKFISLTGSIILFCLYCYLIPFYNYFSKNRMSDTIISLSFNFAIPFMIALSYTSLKGFSMDIPTLHGMLTLLTYLNTFTWISTLFFKFIKMIFYKDFKHIVKPLVIFITLTFFFLFLSNFTYNACVSESLISSIFLFVETTLYVFIIDYILFISSNKNIFDTQEEYNPKTSDLASCKGYTHILFLIMLIYLVFFFLLMCNILSSFGTLLGKTLPLNSSSVITCYNSHTGKSINVFTGVVVAQEENTYYISSENRELIVISSPYVTITPLNQTIPDEQEDGNTRN